MQGRKPKPVELRVLHGGAADRARAEQPKPRRVLPRCPEGLDGEAARCWRRLGRELYDAGLLSVVDRDALAAYCVAWARWRHAEEMVGKSSEVIATAGGNLVQNPWLAVANRAMEQMGKLAAEFGMTPSSRTRVRAEVSAARSQQASRGAGERRSRGAEEQRSGGEGGDDPRRALG